MLNKNLLFSLIALLSIITVSCTEEAIDPITPTNDQVTTSNQRTFGPQILIMSPNWGVNGETCQNERIELSVSGGDPSSYSWDIHGATIISQNGSGIVVQTSPNDGTYITFKVTDAAGRSDVEYGIVDAASCGGNDNGGSGGGSGNGGGSGGGSGPVLPGDPM